MATEQEELQLTVTLDDQASTQLAALQQQLLTLTNLTAPAAHGLSQLAQSLKGAGGHAQGLHGSLGGLAARGGFIGGFFFEVGRSIEQMVKEFAEAVLDIKKYADTMVALDQVSSRAAQSMGQFRSNVAVFRESGVSGEEASKMLSGYANALAELQRPGSRTATDLLRGQSGPFRERMEDLLRTVMTSSQTQGIEAIRTAGRAIRQEHEARGQPERGAAAEASFFARLGMPGLEKVRGHMHEISAEEERMYNDRRKDAERYQTALEKQADAWQRSVESAQSIAFQLIPIASGAEASAKAFNYLAEGVAQLDRAMRNTNTELDKQRSEEARKKVVTPEGKETTAQESLSEDEKRKEALQRKFAPRRTTTTRPGETLPPPDVTTGMDIEFDPLKNAPKRYQPGAGAGYRRVSLLGGEVDTEKKEGAGSTLGEEVGAALGGGAVGLGVGGAVDRLPEEYEAIGWAQIEDRRGESSETVFVEEQSERLGLLNTEVSRLNEYLAPELMRMLLAGTGAPPFHNAPQGGAEGESTPMQLPPGSSQPGGGAASEAAQAARAEPRSRISVAMSEGMKYLEKNETKHKAELNDFMKTGGANLTQDSRAWCARFVDAIQTRAGLPSLESSLPEGQKAGQKDDRTWSSLAYKDWGRGVGVNEDIKEGDVFVKQRKGGGHVGVATGSYRLNEKTGEKEYEMLSGNIGGAKKGGGEVNYTWETLGGRGAGTTAGAGHGGVVAVRRGEEAKAVANTVADTGPEEGAGKGFKLDPVLPQVAQQFAGVGGSGSSMPDPAQAGGQAKPTFDTRGLGIPSPQEALRSMVDTGGGGGAGLGGATGWRGLPLSQNIQDERGANYDPQTGLPLALWRNQAQINPLYNQWSGQQKIAEGGSPQPRPIGIGEEDLPSGRGGGDVMPTDSARPGSAGSALDSAGAVLDRAATDNDVDINQNGRLTVDVKAPVGTSVSTEGGGVFNETETNRSVPMEPATAGG